MTETDLELVATADLEKFRGRAAELGLTDRIEFSGQRLDVPERLAGSDVFLLITKWDGFPRSILEAMRAGLPVVATDVGGCGESVVDGETGYLVPKEDPEYLAEKLGGLTPRGSARENAAPEKSVHGKHHLRRDVRKDPRGVPEFFASGAIRAAMRRST
jgi:glycosyltransferase involved in cell wall biosynthesis